MYTNKCLSRMPLCTCKRNRCVVGVKKSRAACCGRPILFHPCRNATKTDFDVATVSQGTKRAPITNHLPGRKKIQAVRSCSQKYRLLESPPRSLLNLYGQESQNCCNWHQEISIMSMEGLLLAILTSCLRST